MNKTTVTKIDALPKLEKKINVAAYARVSSGKDAMLHSLSSQISYYNQLIHSHDDWLFVGIYADEAITGTKDSREEFKKMIEDCNAGKINLILTKSISRFARNTVTLLETVRKLKEIKVDVFFEEQNIHSMSSEGEMVLTFLASFAQEEARSFSENMKWRIRKDFEEGIIWGGKGCLGYKVIDKKIILIPEQAEIVKMIFDYYLNGYGVEMIAKILTKDKIPTYTNKSEWGKTVIQNILGNYSYTGDLILQKTFRDSYLTKRCKRNKGELNQYLIENNHEPIISKDVFMEVTRIREERAEHFKLKGRNLNEVRYPLSSMIKCGKCGSTFRHKITKYNKVWICATANFKGKEYCHAKAIPEETINKLLCDELKVNELTDTIVKKAIKIIEAFDNNRLVVQFKNGTIKEVFWKDKSRRNSWTPEMKEKARLRALEQHRKAGN